MLEYVVLFLVCVGKALTYNIPDFSHCKGEFFEDQITNRTVIHSNSSRITEMVYSVREDTLYFIYGDNASRQLGVLRIPHRNLANILDIHNPTCIAINQWKNRLFVASPDGIYVKDARNLTTLEKLCNNTCETNIDRVNHMYLDVLVDNTGYKEKIYYSRNYKKEDIEVWSYEKGESPNKQFISFPVEKLVKNENAIYFTYGKNLYRKKTGEWEYERYEQFTGKINVLTADSADTPYIATDDSIYKLATADGDFRKISNITGVLALAFDEAGEPIYATNDTIVQLTNQGCILT